VARRLRAGLLQAGWAGIQQAGDAPSTRRARLGVDLGLALALCCWLYFKIEGGCTVSARVVFIGIYCFKKGVLFLVLI
jgi:hypothetical protein